MFFRDRTKAGKMLADALVEYRGHDDVVVYALPRGGVVLGAEVAKALHAPLDLVITRKVGHPMMPEYGICAVSETGHLLCNEEERARVDPQWFNQTVERERQEAARRRERYLGDRQAIPVQGKVAIIVDDGIATGLTMRAAIHEIKARHPRQVVVAIPVIPPETMPVLQQEADRVVALEVPEVFLGAVGAYYDDFRPVEDEEVIRLLREDPALLFTLPPYDALAKKLLRLPPMRPGLLTLGRFPNDEMRITLQTAVRGERCLLLGSITPPDDHLLSTLLLAHTLKKEGAIEVSLLAPYLAYMRQDRAETGKSRATAWLGALLQASGVDTVVAVDIHSRRDAELIPLPVRSLSPAKLFARAIEEAGLQDATLVAPDEGAIERCNAVQRALKTTAQTAYMEKQRTADGVSAQLHGVVGRGVVVIDDILDTGGTLIACCERLRESGVKEITVMVTHGLFTGDAWLRLWDLDVRHIYCMDTVPQRWAEHPEGIRILSVLPVLSEYLLAEYV